MRGEKGEDQYWPIALAAITLLGAALRLIDLNNLPPGQYLDETNVSILARDSAASHTLQIYYYAPGFGGYHPAAVYTAILWRWLTAGSPYALRDGVAVWSLLSLPLIFFTLRAIFALDEPAARADWLALAGTLLLVLTLSYTINSRNGFEPTLATPPSALTFFGLARSWRTGRRRYLLLAGAGLGLAQYTHIAARLLPLAVAAIVAWVAVAQGRAAWRARLVDLLVIAGASLLVALPLLIYFAIHPDALLARAAATSAGARAAGLAGLPGYLGNSAWRTLAGLVLPGFGDILARHNLPGRPLFDAFAAGCLLLGLAVAARSLRQRSRAVLVGWAAVMLLPGLIAFEHNAPQFGRQVVATPALAALAGLGALAIVDALWPRSPRLVGGLLGAGLVFSAAATGAALFVQWPQVPSLYDDFLVGDWRAANLARSAAATQTVFLSPQLIGDDQHAAFNLLLAGGAVHDFPGPNCLVYRDRWDQPQTYIVFAAADARTSARVLARFPQTAEQPAILHQPNVYPDYRIFAIPAGAPATPPQHTANAVFGGAVGLVGYDLSQTSARPGETIKVTLYWQALAAPLPTYSMFVHLYLPGGDVGAPGVSPQPVAQNDGAPCGQKFPTPRWVLGEIVVDERALTVPSGYPADSAALGLGVYAWPSLERLPVTGQATLPALPGDRVSLGTIKVVR